MKTLTILFMGIVLLASCSDKKQETEKSIEEQHADSREELYNQVMAVHDEVMPKMDEIYRLKTKLQEELQDLLQNKSEANAEQIKSLTDKINSLENASKEMMVWMRQFDVQPDSLGHEVIMEGLNEEMKKIEKVKRDMLDAIQSAKE
jgi:predicted house-cleaning noncanonical NTP pyrophosphatase (MazG superfamily)